MLDRRETSEVELEVRRWSWAWLTPNSRRGLNHGKHFAPVHQIVFDDRSQRERGKERERPDNQDSTHEKPDKERTVRGKCSRCGRNLLFAGEASGRGE